MSTLEPSASAVPSEPPSAFDRGLAAEVLEQGQPVCALDRDYRLLAVNAAFERMARARRGDVLGRSMWEVLPPPADRGGSFWAQLRQAMDDRVPVEFEAFYAPLDRWLAVHASPIAAGVAVFLHDLTALKRADEALLEADRRKNQFLAMLSHELRNPLAPIRNALHVLSRAAPGGDVDARAREVLARQVGQLSRLVDDLLDVTRIARDKLELRPTRLDLAELVRRVCEDHRSSVEGRGARLALVLRPDPLWVNGDATRLAQLAGNLLHNSAKFVSPGGAVWVTLDVDHGAARLRVRDDGAGIEPTLLARIFEPYVQGPGGGRPHGGLGLGLALVKGLAELHGGSVEASSAGHGAGAEFTVRLPVAPPPEAVPAPRPPGPARSHRRVLIVEDSHDTAQTLADLVGMLGHEVSVTLDGESALARARADPPDVVLCDIGLPGMSGYDVARALRADPATRAAALVAVSGFAQPEDLRAARQAGFDHHVAKPPDPEVISRLLA